SGLPRASTLRPLTWLVAAGSGPAPRSVRRSERRRLISLHAWQPPRDYPVSPQIALICVFDLPRAAKIQEARIPRIKVDHNSPKGYTRTRSSLLTRQRPGATRAATVGAICPYTLRARVKLTTMSSAR